MAGIVDAMRDILATLGTVPITNKDNNSAAVPYVRVWNNQLQKELQEKDSNLEGYPKPAFFLQVLSPLLYQQLGQGMRSADPTFRIHIIDEYYNAPDGTMEQDLDTFQIASDIQQVLCFFKPAGCGPLTCIAEEQDDDHGNLYHLILDFQCNFTNSKGSPLDTGRTDYIESTPPTALEIDITVATGGGQMSNQQFIINK